MKIAIGNDHGGYMLKKALVTRMAEISNVEAIDIGCNSEKIVRYPYYAARVARMILSGEADRGILICSTGIGMSIAANKYKGIRAAVVYSSYQARMTRAHNDSNVLCLGGKCIGQNEALDYLEIWLDTAYMGGRHDISLGLLSEIEASNFGPGSWNTGIPE